VILTLARRFKSVTFVCMCGRFTKDWTWEEIYAFSQPLTLERYDQSNLQPSYNICPTDTVDTLVMSEGKTTIVPMRWGLIPSWWKKPLKEFKLATFNARAETIEEKATYKSAFKRRRCIIPASGYYEWETTPSGKQPHYYTRTDGKLIGIAGIWEEWTDTETGEIIKSCAMVITEPSKFAAKYHDRMPVILEPEQFEAWLTAQSGTEVLKPAAEDILQERPVSRRVNSSRADKSDNTLIEEAA
jgi:putative SOS response-associated peptidase YedK